MPVRILVIEDNPANMELMAYLLNAFGYDVLAAHDGNKGIATARREMPDLIVCDVNLPQLDGYGVVQAMKSDPALRNTPIIAVTALAMTGDREKLLEAGFDGYLSKPIEPETFVSTLEGYLHTNARPSGDSAAHSASASNRTPHAYTHQHDKE